MKIFEGEESAYPYDKVNFVDENDVFVGYDTGQDCCEHADWFISEVITPYDYDKLGNLDEEKNTPDIEGYFFDKEFFQEIESSDLDEGGMVAFKLVCDDKPDLHLHLFNAHNGYYGHGFEVKHGGEIVKEGSL